MVQRELRCAKRIPSGQKAPNAWGLWNDMEGNVAKGAIAGFFTRRTWRGLAIFVADESDGSANRSGRPARAADRRRWPRVLVCGGAAVWPISRRSRVLVLDNPSAELPRRRARCSAGRQAKAASDFLGRPRHHPLNRNR